MRSVKERCYYILSKYKSAVDDTACFLTFYRKNFPLSIYQVEHLLRMRRLFIQHKMFKQSKEASARTKYLAEYFRQKYGYVKQVGENVIKY